MDAAFMPEPLANTQSDFDVKDVKDMHPYRHGILLQGCETEFVSHLFNHSKAHIIKLYH